jgi:hypothetical protein
MSVALRQIQTLRIVTDRLHEVMFDIGKGMVGGHFALESLPPRSIDKIVYVQMDFKWNHIPAFEIPSVNHHVTLNTRGLSGYCYVKQVDH